MRKLLLTLAVLCGTVSGWAQTSLRISEGLLEKQKEGTTQYEWTSNTLFAPTEGDFNKLRITFFRHNIDRMPAGFPFVCIAEFYLYDKAGNRVELSVDNFSSNATQGNEGKMSAICNGFTTKQNSEGENDWYWHSQWSGTPSPYGYHYLEIDLTDIEADLSEYKIGWVTRQHDASPKDIIISTGETTEEAAKNANSQMLPQVSTEIAKIYTIKSVRTKKFLAYDETQAKPQQINAVNNNCYWYFTQGTDDKVVMHNAVSGKELGINYEMSYEGEWYVSPAEYRPGVVFSKTDNITQGNCIDDQSGSIGPWSHTSGDNEGTTWLLEEVANAPVDVPVASLTKMKIERIGSPVEEIELGKWYVLSNVGRNAYVSQEANSWKMRAKNSVVAEQLAADKAGYLFKITQNGENYNIMSGNGKYFQLGYNSASTSATPVNFEIKLIDGNNFCLFDKDHKYAADGQEVNNAFVGWSSTIPTNAGGNDSYNILPVELTDLGEITKEELSVDITNAKTIKNHIGEGVGKYTAPADFETQLAPVTAFYVGIDMYTTLAAINAKKTELETLMGSVQLNMPIAGKFYRMHNDNQYITGSVVGGRIALSETNNDAASVYYYDGTHLLAYGTGLYMGLNKDDWTFEAVGSTDISTIEFVAAVNGAVAKYNIKSGERWLHRTDSYVNRCTNNTCGDPHNWTIEEVTWLPVPMNVEAGYATLYSPVALSTYNWNKDGRRVEAYTGVIDGEKLSLTRIDAEDGIIPANTPVVLKYVADAETGNVFLQVSDSEKAAIESDLKGTLADAYISESSYVLSMPTIDGEVQKVGFYKATMNQQGGTHFLNNGFRAYLPAGENNARSLVFDFGGTETGIDGLKGENGNVKAEVYDLAGRRVLNAKKGVFVVNGKVIVK